MDGASGMGKQAGKGKSSPHIAKWLTDVRKCSSDDVVTVIQSDAIERKGLKQLLLEPETLQTIKPDVSMVATIMELNRQIPEKANESAREAVKTVVDELMSKMEQELRRAVTGALNKKNHSPIPSVTSIYWKKTIRDNIAHYDTDTNRIIPEKFHFFKRTRKMKEWTVMVVAFDTEVVDLTETVRSDPVDVLFGVQLGGGTDINKSVQYCSQFIDNPGKTMFILISDLYEGGVEAGLLKRLEAMKESGVKVIVLLALSDSGTPSFDERLGKKISALGIPCFASTPNKLPELVENALKGRDLLKFNLD